MQAEVPAESACIGHETVMGWIIAGAVGAAFVLLVLISLAYLWIQLDDAPADGERTRHRRVRRIMANSWVRAIVVGLAAVLRMFR